MHYFSLEVEALLKNCLKFFQTKPNLRKIPTRMTTETSQQNIELPA